MSRQNYPWLARRQKLRRSQENWNLTISSLPDLRTLKRTARNKIERQRAPNQWILPGVRGPTRVRNRLVYPQATLMGLPAELRQQILYMSYNMANLEADLKAGLEAGKLLLGSYPAPHAKQATTIIVKEVIDDRLDLLRLSRRQGTLAVLLGRRMEALSCLAPVIKDDMQYVGKRWQRDFESQIGQEIKNRLSGQRLQLRNVAKAFESLHNRACDDIPGVQIAQAEEKIPKGNKPRSKKYRPASCWYCMERHQNRDLTCPMARENPEKWKKMTRNVGGWRGKVATLSAFKGKKVIFDD